MLIHADPALRTLRSELDDCLSRLAYRVEQQIPVIEKLGAKIPHSIELVQAVRQGERDSYCYTHALSMQSHRGKGPEKEFVELLLAEGVLLPRSEGDPPQPGDFVYYHDSTDGHGGIWRDGRVESKWGTTHAWNHAPFELPLSYGNTAGI